MKEYNNAENVDSSKSLTSRSLYIGFLGKVIGTTLFFMMLFFITPMLNPIKDGANLFVDSYTVQYMGATLQGKLFGYSMTLNGYLLSLPIAFEAMMFVHAMMKDSVLGIDERLRKTFGTAILTGIGAILFLIGSEAVEGLLPFPGVVGGVLLGGTILLVRKPVMQIADRFSGRILVSSYSDICSVLVLFLDLQKLPWKNFSRGSTRVAAAGCPRCSPAARRRRTTAVSSYKSTRATGAPRLSRTR